MLDQILGNLFKQNFASISAKEASTQISKGYYFVLDVRSTPEFAQGKIKGAKNIPLNELPQRLKEISQYKEEPVLVNCLSGGRSAAACDMLVKAGFKDVTNLSGGMSAWSSSGLKVA